MNKEQKSLIKSIIITVVIIILSGVAFIFLSKGNLFKGINENVNVKYDAAESNTVMNLSGKQIFVSTSIINVKNEEPYNFKLALETVDNYHGRFSYEIKLNDTVIVPETSIEGYKNGDLITMYEGILPETGSKFTVILKNYDYIDTLNTSNKIKFIY